MQDLEAVGGDREHEQQREHAGLAPVVSLRGRDGHGGGRDRQQDGRHGCKASRAHWRWDRQTGRSLDSRRRYPDGMPSRPAIRPARSQVPGARRRLSTAAARSPVFHALLDGCRIQWRPTPLTMRPARGRHYGSEGVGKPWLSSADDVTTSLGSTNDRAPAEDARPPCRAFRVRRPEAWTFGHPPLTTSRSHRILERLRPRERAPSMRAPKSLHVPAFRRLAASYTLNELGWGFGTVALAVLVFDRTGSALATTALFLGTAFLPALLAPALTARLDRLAVRRALPLPVPRRGGAVRRPRRGGRAFLAAGPSWRWPSPMARWPSPGGR